MYNNESFPARIKKSWVEYFLPAVTLIVGTVGTIVWNNFSNALESGDYLPTAVFVSVVIILGFCLAIWRTTKQKISEIERQTSAISKAIGQKANVLPYAQGYTLLQSRYEQAKNEILILSKYVFDWESKKPIYDPKRLASSSRRKSYAAAIDKIKTAMRERNFKYSLVVQIPEGSNLTDIFPFDAIYKKYAKLLMRSNKVSPEAASLKITDVVFPNSFVLVNRSFLYMEFEIRDPDTGEMKAPFVLTIDDPNSEMVTELLHVHQRLESSATLLMG